ncbi:agamous-like MADS-box protein AGL80 isoform X2 [Raphanus sativus]|uniref:Agamous-like MADS-box protein AGL80 isoform X2 n=1 Tax=Raphanus sativus TaxID=3726 RepID=A0A6J0P070_RAPSA|nr:agamous-like MADS-box protein AGL80 isoform X2 [Raphanus sativus]
MTRKKLNISYITNDSMRKSTFNKRKKGFFKKIYELSVLCGIQACAVIYSPFSSTPEVWPSNSEVKKVVEKFEQIPDTEQEKKMVNHEGFLRQSITKTRENITKKIMDNTDMAMNETMFQFLRGRGDMFQLTDKHRDDLCRHIDQYLKELYHHRKILSQSHLEHGESSSAANAMTQPAAIAEEGSSSLPNPDAFNNLNPNQYQQNFEGCPNSQDGIYNQNHQQEEWLVSQMMNNPNQVRFPMMDDNNHQQP